MLILTSGDNDANLFLQVSAAIRWHQWTNDRKDGRILIALVYFNSCYRQKCEKGHRWFHKKLGEVLATPERREWSLDDDFDGGSHGKI